MLNILQRPPRKDRHFIVNGEKFWRVGRQYADKHDVKYIPWDDWENLRVGLFVCTDDFWVVKLNDIRKVNTITIYNTSWGSYTDEYTKLNIGHMAHRRAGFIPSTYKVLDNGLTATEKACVDYMLMWPNRSLKDVYETFYADDCREPRSYIKFLKKENIMNYISSKIASAMENAGVTETWWMQLVKGIVTDEKVKMKDKREFVYIIAGLLDIPAADMPVPQQLKELPPGRNNSLQPQPTRRLILESNDANMLKREGDDDDNQ